MSKRRTFAILSVGVTLTLSNTVFAGPFTDANKLGDLMMAMAPAYALGMTVMEKIGGARCNWRNQLSQPRLQPKV